MDGVVARFKKFPTLEEAEEFMTTSDPKDAGKTRKFVCFIIMVAVILRLECLAFPIQWQHFALDE